MLTQRLILNSPLPQCLTAVEPLSHVSGHESLAFNLAFKISSFFFKFKKGSVKRSFKRKWFLLE